MPRPRRKAAALSLAKIAAIVEGNHISSMGGVASTTISQASDHQESTEDLSTIPEIQAKEPRREEGENFTVKEPTPGRARRPSNRKTSSSDDDKQQAQRQDEEITDKYIDSSNKELISGTTKKTKGKETGPKSDGPKTYSAKSKKNPSKKTKSPPAARLKKKESKTNSSDSMEVPVLGTKTKGITTEDVAIKSKEEGDASFTLDTGPPKVNADKFIHNSITDNKDDDQGAETNRGRSRKRSLPRSNKRKQQSSQSEGPSPESQATMGPGATSKSLKTTVDDTTLRRSKRLRTCVVSYSSWIDPEKENVQIKTQALGPEGQLQEPLRPPAEQPPQQLQPQPPVGQEVEPFLTQVKSEKDRKSVV